MDNYKELKSKSRFTNRGKLAGVQFSVDTLDSGVVRIRARVPSLNDSYGMSRELRYTGDFEEFWTGMRKRWVLLWGLLPIDLIGYSEELRNAKRVYMREIYAYESRGK